MTMKEFKKYLDNLIALKEDFILKNRKQLMTTYYGKLAKMTEYERLTLILKEYKDIREVIDLWT